MKLKQYWATVKWLWKNDPLMLLIEIAVLIFAIHVLIWGGYELAYQLTKGTE